MACFKYLLVLAFLGFSQPDLANPFYQTSSSAPLSLSSIALSQHTTLLQQLIADKQLRLSSDHGSIHIDTHSHRLWIYDDATHTHKLRQLVQQLNQQPQQISLHARIISIDSKYLKSLGLLLTTVHDTPNHDYFSMDFPQVNPTQALTIPLTTLAHGQTLDAKIMALQQQGHAQLLSKPQLITLNNKAAIIESGEEVPYQQATSSGATSVAFKKAVLKLKVTPSIYNQNNLLLNINIHQDKVSALTVNGVPAIHTQQISTTVELHNQQTLVIGGIIERSNAKQVDKVPLLSSLPLLGQLFQQKHVKQIHKELLIFITPSIL